MRGEGLLSFYNGCEKGYIRCDDPTLFEGQLVRSACDIAADFRISLADRILAQAV